MLKVRTTYETDNGTTVEVTSPELPTRVALALQAAHLKLGRPAKVVLDGPEGAREVLP